MGREAYGIDPGCRADLVVLPVPDVHEAIRTRPEPSAVLKNGCLLQPRPS
jgi:cytosine/creatinine deaminase